MRYFIIPAIVVVLLTLMCCTPHANQDLRNPENEALAIKFIEAVLKPDFEVIEGFLSDDYKEYGPAAKDSVDRTTAIANWRKAWEEKYSSMTYDRYGTLSTTVPKGRVAGDWVLDWGKWTINYKDGRPSVTIWFHAALRMKDRKINRQRNFYDTGDIMGQQEFSFVPPYEEVK